MFVSSFPPKCYVSNKSIFLMHCLILYIISILPCFSKIFHNSNNFCFSLFISFSLFSPYILALHNSVIPVVTCFSYKTDTNHLRKFNTGYELFMVGLSWHMFLAAKDCCAGNKGVDIHHFYFHVFLSSSGFPLLSVFFFFSTTPITN